MSFVNHRLALMSLTAWISLVHVPIASTAVAQEEKNTVIGSSQKASSIAVEGVETQDTYQHTELLRSAVNGDASAQYKLGMDLLQGAGFPQNFAKAAFWFGKAANQGHTDAQGELGILYYNAQGVKHDNIEAYKWLNLAATKGDARWTNFRNMARDLLSQEGVTASQQLASDLQTRLEGVKSASLPYSMSLPKSVTRTDGTQLALKAKP